MDKTNEVKTPETAKPDTMTIEQAMEKIAIQQRVLDSQNEKIGKQTSKERELHDRISQLSQKEKDIEAQKADQLKQQGEFKTLYESTQKQLTDLTKRLEDEAAARQQAEKLHRETLVETSIERVLSPRINRTIFGQNVDPVKEAARLIDRTALTIDESGTITNLDAVISDLFARMPALATATGNDQKMMHNTRDRVESANPAVIDKLRQAAGTTEETARGMVSTKWVNWAKTNKVYPELTVDDYDQLAALAKAQEEPVK